MERTLAGMERFLASTVYVFHALSLAHWCHLAHFMRNPPLGCGNVITDPLLILVNWIGPYTALCVAALLVGRMRRRCRPRLPLLVLPLFLGTWAALAAEVVWLRDYGIYLAGSVWWLPWL
jgi:hypothetical protein